MSLFSPLLVICLDPDEASTAGELARSLGYPDAHVVTGGFDAAVQALHRRTTSPDYIIIDIGSLTHDILPSLDSFALHCEPQVRVVVIGSINDITFYRELKSRGVLEYFNRPVAAGDVRPVLLSAQLQRYQPGAPAPQGRVITFMSAASGEGASTLAVNFAYALAEHQPTVLVDMDYQFGLIAKSLDLAAPFGIRELFDHPDRGLDRTMINKMLVKYSDNLSIIAAPSELKLLPLIRPELIRELISILRSQFSFVVIDLPHIWTDWTAAALTYSDHAVMVGQLWLRSLTHASRLLSAWQGVGIPRESIALVINRSGAKFKEAISTQDFERICRRRIDAHVGNDVKALAYAETHAKTLFEINQDTPLIRDIRQLAKKLVGRYLPQGTFAEEAPAKKGLFGKISKLR